MGCSLVSGAYCFALIVLLLLRLSDTVLADPIPKSLSGPFAKEKHYKDQEKADMKYRKGLFRMGMELQGLMDQLAKTDSKEMAVDIKKQINKIRAKAPGMGV